MKDFRKKLKNRFFNSDDNLDDLDLALLSGTLLAPQLDTAFCSGRSVVSRCKISEGEADRGDQKNPPGREMKKPNNAETRFDLIMRVANKQNMKKKNQT